MKVPKSSQHFSKFLNWGQDSSPAREGSMLSKCDPLTNDF